MAVHFNALKSLAPGKKDFIVPEAEQNSPG